MEIIIIVIYEKILSKTLCKIKNKVKIKPLSKFEIK